MKNSIAITFQHSAGSKVHLRQMKWRVLGKDRSLPHFGRKIYHLLMGALCFTLYAFVLTQAQAVWALAIIGGVFVFCDLFRLKLPALNHLVLSLFGKIMRREELKSVSGNSFYILGLLVIVLAFPKPIVLLSILYLAIGDPSAAIVGTLYGKHRLFGKKSLEGAAANFILSGLVTFIVAIGYFGFPSYQCLLLAFVGAMASTISEIIPLPLDDNFSIPVVSAILLTFASTFLPLF